MRKIDKTVEPVTLSQWKIGNRGSTYEDLPHGIRVEVRQSCTAEQLYVCAYCCSYISGASTDTMNEHIKSRRNFPKLQLNYENIVASCTTPNQCDDAHGSNDFELTPLMVECEEEFSYLVSGAIRAHSSRADETITALNLGRNIQENKRLVETRRASIMAYMFSQGMELTEVANDPELKEILIDEISSVSEGKLTPFAPIIVSVIRAFT